MPGKEVSPANNTEKELKLDSPACECIKHSDEFGSNLFRFVSPSIFQTFQFHNPFSNHIPKVLSHVPAIECRGYCQNEQILPDQTKALDYSPASAEVQATAIGRSAEAKG